MDRLLNAHRLVPDRIAEEPLLLMIGMRDRAELFRRLWRGNDSHAPRVDATNISARLETEIEKKRTPAAATCWRPAHVSAGCKLPKSTEVNSQSSGRVDQPDVRSALNVKTVITRTLPGA
jgi:hypothetical protein